jgi:hypothetical protein
MVHNWESILLNADVSIHAIDIGCSSDRPYQWERLGSALHYVGIDPLKNEISRLNNLKKANSTYKSGLLKIDGATGRADEATMNFFNRTSAWKEMQSGYDQVATTFNSGLEVLIDETKVSMHELLDLLPSRNVDLLKIDIDGDDYLAMRQFFKTRVDSELLLLDIESQFHGDLGDEGNTLWNIGKLANENNLHLYDLEVNRYSRRVLPSKFLYDFPAQTQNGQALWGDATFAKDGLDGRLPLVDKIKLIAIYEIYGLYDCALETLENSYGDLSQIMPVEEISKSLIASNDEREARATAKSRIAIDKTLAMKVLRRLRLFR